MSDFMEWLKRSSAQLIREGARADQELEAHKEAGTAPPCFYCSAPTHPTGDFCPGCKRHVCEDCAPAHYDHPDSDCYTNPGESP